jgi:sugar/nucleoside kinase (ribokinase family)
VAANVTVVAARAGAPVALAGGAGDDVWGEWLLGRLRKAGVDVSLFALIPELETQLAFVTVDAEGEPAYHVRGRATGTIVPVLGERLERSVSESAALFISTNTLVGGEERALTMRARELAIGLDRR